MHRAIVGRSRVLQLPPQPSAPPKLVLIEGGRSDKIPIVQLFQAVSCLLFLHEVNSLFERNRRRRHEALAKAVTLIKSQPSLPERDGEPVTGVHLVFAERALDQIIERADAKSRERSLYIPRHVLRQYVRWVLGYRGGLNKLLLKRAKDVMERFVAQGKGGKPFDQVHELEFDALRTTAKRWVSSAVDTKRKTRKGYAILEAMDKDENRLFVTIHHDRRTVIGIYTESHFGRDKRYSRSRRLSNQRARVYRKNKRVNCYRS